MKIEKNNKEDKTMETKIKEKYQEMRQAQRMIKQYEIEETKKITCEICGKILENAKQDEDGYICGIGCNNPAPLNYIVCCDECNKVIVMPIREVIAEARHIVKEKKDKKIRAVLQGHIEKK